MKRTLITNREFSLKDRGQAEATAYLKLYQPYAPLHSVFTNYNFLSVCVLIYMDYWYWYEQALVPVRT